MIDICTCGHAHGAHYDGYACKGIVQFYGEKSPQTAWDRKGSQDTSAALGRGFALCTCHQFEKKFSRPDI